MGKLGTTRRPAVLRVKSMERADEVMAIAEENGWKVIVGVEPDKPENTADLEGLMQRGASRYADSCSSVAMIHARAAAGASSRSAADSDASRGAEHSS